MKSPIPALTELLSLCPGVGGCSLHTVFAPAAAASTSSGVNDKENRSDLQAGGTILLTGGKPATSKAGSNLKFVTGGRVSKGVSRKMDYLHRGAESKKAALEQRRQQNPSAPVC